MKRQYRIAEIQAELDNDIQLVVQRAISGAGNVGDALDICAEGWARTVEAYEYRIEELERQLREARRCLDNR